MSEIINVETYIKKGDKLYKQSGETNILTYDSLDAVPDDLPEGSFVAVPSEDNVVDLTGVFDYVTSVAAGGAMQYVDYDCTEIVELLKKGAVKFKVAFNGSVSESYVFGSIFNHEGGYGAQVNGFVLVGGVLLYMYTTFSIDYSHIEYKCVQVPTTAYVPS